MKIAILTSGILPVPAVQGGAVENLVDFYLEYNDLHKLHDITVYSVYHEAVKQHPALRSQVNHYEYIDMNSRWARCKKTLYHKLHGEEYYHYNIEYFLHQAIKKIKKQHFDVIILENRPGYALKIKKHTTAKLVYHLHNDFLNSDSPQGQTIYAEANKIVTISDFITQRVKTLNPSDNKCVTIYNGIDLQKFSSKQECASRHDFGLHADDFVVVFSGRIIPEKGISQLIDAMALLKDYPKIKLLIVGSSFYGNEEGDSSFVCELKRKAAYLQDRIYFTGFIPYKDMPKILSLANIAVAPSVWDEPLGLTCLEAIAAGLPLITTRRGGIPEIFTHAGLSAILLDTDKNLSANLAKAILSLYEDSALCERMKQASQDAVSKYYAKNVYASSFFQTIEFVDKEEK